jgi:hypothetical protein
LPRHVRQKAPRPKVKSRQKRRLMHEVWPMVVAYPVGAVGSRMEYYLRVYESAFTEKEIKYLRKRAETLKEVHADLMTIYFRLKF